MTRKDKQREDLLFTAPLRQEISDIKWYILVRGLATLAGACLFTALIGGVFVASPRDAEHVIPVYNKSGGIAGYLTEGEAHARVVLLFLALGLGALSLTVHLYRVHRCSRTR
jgi:hypothetical protein